MILIIFDKLTKRNVSEPYLDNSLTKSKGINKLGASVGRLTVLT